MSHSQIGIPLKNNISRMISNTSANINTIHEHESHPGNRRTLPEHENSPGNRKTF